MVRLACDTQFQLRLALSLCGGKTSRAGETTKPLRLGVEGMLDAHSTTSFTRRCK